MSDASASLNAFSWDAVPLSSKEYSEFLTSLKELLLRGRDDGFEDFVDMMNDSDAMIVRFVLSTMVEFVPGQPAIELTDRIGVQVVHDLVEQALGPILPIKNVGLTDERFADLVRQYAGAGEDVLATFTGQAPRILVAAVMSEPEFSEIIRPIGLYALLMIQNSSE